MFAARLTKKRTLFVVPVLAALCIFAAAGFSHPIHAAPQQAPPPAGKPPVLSAQQQLVHQGKLIFDFTPHYAPQWTGNVLTCTDCHRLSGTVPYATPLTMTSQRYPSFSQRAGHMVNLQQRIQECFVRSENGKPLPIDSPQMKALVAYINSLWTNRDKSQPAEYRALVKLPALKGDPVRGHKIYTAQCADCHQADGAGIPDAYPPLWGPQSYNDGAGMSHPAKFAAWVQHNMPLQNPGILTAQEAYDVAAYVDSQPRPKFKEKYKKY